MWVYKNFFKKLKTKQNVNTNFYYSIRKNNFKFLLKFLIFILYSNNLFLQNIINILNFFHFFKIILFLIW